MRNEWSLVLSFVALLMACGDEKVAGGISEETNTIAGILRKNDGSLSIGVPVMARHLEYESVVFYDTTDSEGRYAMPLRRVGSYGISAVSGDSSAYYEVVQYNGEKLEISGRLSPTFNIGGRVLKSDRTAAESYVVSLPGSAWMDRTDSSGAFLLRNVPRGMFVVETKLVKGGHSDISYYVVKDDGTCTYRLGPMPLADAEIMVNSRLDDEHFVASENCAVPPQSKGGKDSDLSNVVQKDDETSDFFFHPYQVDVGVLGLWHFDELLKTDEMVRSKNEVNKNMDVVFYGSPTIVLDGVLNGAVELRDEDDYGFIEDDHGVMDFLTGFSLEVWVNVASIEGRSPYRKNIVGKVGFGDEQDKDVFSLAVIKDECGVDGPAFAFFMADGSGDSLSCDRFLDAPVELDKWTYLAAAWDGKRLSFFKDGEKHGEIEVPLKSLSPSAEPIFFGKESMNMKLDEVRLVSKALSPADVYYRYRLKGGAL